MRKTPEYLRKRAQKKLAARSVTVGECLEWQGRRNPKGCGLMRLLNEQLAHRAAWVAAHGPIPAGLCVLHRCDNPRCVNPEHLSLGTFADNNRDREAKGRSARLRGERHPRSSLTDAQRAELVQRFGAGECGRHLAREYGVHHSTVYASAHRAQAGARP